MSLKIAICDDHDIERNHILALVSTWAKHTKRDVVLRTFSSGEAFLFEWESQKDYDILLLDIEMDEVDGISVARRVRKDSELVQIVFITGYLSYIAEGYEVSALHYLVKPIHEEKLYATLDRAVHKLHQNEKTLRIKVGSDIFVVPLYEVSYMEVRQNYVTIYAKSAYTQKRTLTDIEGELDSRFFRVGRSYIINLQMVEKVTKTQVFLRGGVIIPLPRGMYEPLNEAIIKRL